MGIFKLMKRSIFILLLILVALILAGCGTYASHYSAVLLVTTESSKGGSISFSSFSGTKAFKFKSDGQLNYSAKLEEGKATVYYDDGAKKELFTIAAGQEIGPSSIPVDSGTVHVIIQTDGKCRQGEFRFDVK